MNSFALQDTVSTLAQFVSSAGGRQVFLILELSQLFLSSYLPPYSAELEALGCYSASSDLLPVYGFCLMLRLPGIN